MLAGRGWGFTVRTGCVGGLDCVSCVSDGLCVCSLVTLVVLCDARGRLGRLAAERWAALELDVVATLRDVVVASNSVVSAPLARERLAATDVERTTGMVSLDR